MTTTRPAWRIRLYLTMLVLMTGALLVRRPAPVNAQGAVVGQPGVIAAYGFEEGTGTTAADSTGNNNTGTVSATTWSTTGKYGKALSFNGSSSRVNIPDAAALDLTVGMTIEAWVNPATLTGWRTVIMKETANGLAYALYAHDGSRPAGYVEIGSADYDVSGTTALPVNSWTHLATTYDGTTMRLYVNGTQVATRARTGNIATSASPLRIGGNAPWGEYFSGLIDEVRVYGRALSAAEVQADMAAPIVQTDTTAPTVSLVSPAGGSTNVNRSANVTAVFSEAMNASTITTSTFELRNPSNQLVTAAVTYDPAAFTATLDPAADLAAGTTFTATVRGGGTDPRARDASGNALASNVVWSFTTVPADTTPPTVTGFTPASGAAGVAIASNLTATFSEALDTATINATTFELRDAANQLVPAAVAYSAATLTATLDPSADLTYGAVYTAMVRGGAADPRVKDVAGNALAAPLSWSFTTVPPPCPCTVWLSSATPATPDYPDSNSVEAGVKFRSDRAGYITSIRFYKGAGNTGAHIGSLWTTAGTRLAAVAFSGETASGWQQADFSPAVPISANTVYVASYFAPVGHYAADLSFFGAEVTRGPLHMLADSASPNGVYLYTASGAFPNQSFSASNYWVDVVFADTVAADTTPPTVTTVSPAANAVGVAHSASITATFSEALDPTTVTTATVELTKTGGTVVPGAVSYDALNRRMTLQPSAPLDATTVHTVKLRGGTTGNRIKDLAGNFLAADFAWSFTTAGVPSNDGPGGPILVVASTKNPFSRYLGEIIRSEGLNAYTVMDVSLVSTATLTSYDVVVLGEMALTSDQVTLFSNWATSGGKLIAMRPDKQLASLLGLTDAGTTLANQYLLIDGTGPGTGLVNQTIQFHGAADLYTLTGATSLATLYSSAATATANPAVTLRSVGTAGGQVAAFTYDLARSVVYTRQGNPAWSGQERDGQTPIRSDDLFYGAAPSDPQTDWVDLNKVTIPQADEQQRLFANLILQMSMDRKPLPRFWYLPRDLKAAVVMTGDDHANGGTAGRFDAYKAASPAGCSVANWECIRGTSYVYPNSPLTNAQAIAYTADGFEVALHVTTNCENYTAPSLDATYTGQLSQFAASYPGVPAPTTNRTHCIVWSDYATQPTIERSKGIRFDTTYYYWPSSWVQDRAGLFTGSGMPMRYAGLDGSLIDVYQATTQMTDESGQTYPLTMDLLLDRAIGAEGYYGVFTANMHTDAVPHAGSDGIVNSAKARGVPVVTSLQMLTWLDGRNNSSFGTIGYTGGTLTFTVVQGAGANGLQGMIPAQTAAGQLLAITRGGTPVTFTVKTIKGRSYATFTALAGAHTAVYGSVPDTTITAMPPASTTSTSASFTFTATPAAGATFQCALDGAAFAACVTPQNYTGLAVASHTFQVRAVNPAGTDATPASFAWTIIPAPPDTSITSSPPASTTSTSASFTFTATPAAGATFQCALDGAAFAACASPQNYTGLAVASHTFQVRGVNAGGTDATPASFTWTITGSAPDTTITANPPASTTSTSASFSFTATPATGATFQCSLDGVAFAACTTPRSYTALALGSHTFQVRAVNTGGTDPTPASFTWTITSAGGGLVAAYGFEETTGTTTEDSSGLGNTGTLANATRATTGRFGRALSFNGTNAWVTAADAASLDLSNAMTFEAWVNPTTLTDWRTILMKEAPSGLAYGLYAHDGSRPAAYIHVGNNDVGRQGTATLAANTWTHVAATYDGATLRLYINGTQVATTAIAGSVAATTGALRIGGNSAWGEYFAGMIDEVRVYSRVLTAAEITTDMNTAVKP